jgi:hypothetical protein
MTQGAERAWNSVLDDGGGGDLSRYYAALALKAAGHQEGAAEETRRWSAGRPNQLNELLCGRIGRVGATTRSACKGGLS